MNAQEYLLACLGEEAIEISAAAIDLLTVLEVSSQALKMSKASMKALRFGLSEGYPGTDKTNAGDLNDEFNDLMAIIEILNDKGLTNIHYDSVKIEAKKEKLLKYAQYAVNRGVLSEKLKLDSGGSG